MSATAWIRAAIDHPRAVWLLPMLVAAVLTLPRLGDWAAPEGHEALVARTAVEMRGSGDWVLPTFNGEPRLQKPPLAYWLAMTVAATLPVDPLLAARLPSALAVMLTAGLIAGWTGQRFGRRAGLLAGLLHATTWGALAFGRNAQVEAVLVLLVTALILVALGPHPQSVVANGSRSGEIPIINRLRHAGWFRIPGCWMLAGLIILAKGPVGLAVAVPVILVSWWFRRSASEASPPFARSVDEPSPSISSRPPEGSVPQAHVVGLMLFLILALGWPIAVLQRMPDAGALWWGQSVGRYVERFGPQTRPWWLMPLAAAGLTLPWSPLLLATALAAVRRRFQRTPGKESGEIDPDRSAEGARRLALGLMTLWLVWGVLFFTLSAGRRGHYLLPALPPVAILIAGLVGPMLTGRLIGASLVAASLWFAYAVAIAPSFLRRPGLEAMLAASRARLDRAPAVVQVGNGDRGTIVAVDRPMRFASSADLRGELADRPGALLLVTETELPTVLARIPSRVIARMGNATSAAERHPKRRFALLEPVASPAEPGRELTAEPVALTRSAAAGATR